MLSIRTQAATRFLERQRTDETFENFYESIIADSKDLTDDPKLPRKKRTPRRFDAGSNAYHPQTASKEETNATSF